MTFERNISVTRVESDPIGPIGIKKFGQLITFFSLSVAAQRGGWGVLVPRAPGIFPS